MAGGNKKKKKPAANPARGFATTSVASKSKPDEGSDTTSGNHSATPTPTDTPDTSVASGSNAPKTEGHSDTARQLHELSPEELEAQLEASELQQFVESYAGKTKKEIARQVSRLHTDKRLLRGQADYLAVREWLPEELMQQVLDLTLTDLEQALDGQKKQKLPVGDDLVSKVWQLRQCLLDIAIPPTRVNEVLGWIISTCPQIDTSTGLVWGLEESLDWLALRCGTSELDEYDTVKTKANAVPSSDLNDIHSSPDSADKLIVNGNSTTQVAEQNGTSRDDPVDEEIEVSDVASDVEPDELLAIYLRTRARLFELNPDTQQKQRGKPKSDAASARTAKASTGRSGTRKLEQKLQKIESDILFDKHAAESQWAVMKTDLAREAAERRKLQLEHNSAGASGHTREPSTTEKDISAEAEQLGREMLQESEDMDDGDMLSGMFDALPGVQQANNTGEIAQATDGPGVLIRDFGRLTGMNPKRLLEEACRARDPRCKISYKMVSPTTYACRHAIFIQWTKMSEIAEHAFLASVKVDQKASNTSVTMITVATPDVAQSEAYVSTAALFLIFSGSAKEEKAHLRLPPAFRDLWDEFMIAKRDHVDKVDRELVKDVRDLIDQHRSPDDEDDDSNEVIFDANSRRRLNGTSGANTPVSTSEPSKSGALECLEELQQMWAKKVETPAYQRMLEGRQKLPMFQFRSDALETIRRHQVTILCGETGCGKSTQLPAFILEHELSQGRPCKIYCTEPRRISAISLAQRVSEEMGENKGDVGTSRSLVGYAIRLESQTSAQTRLVYATTGIVLRMLESAGGLNEITHLVIDEVHERSIDTDFLLIILRTLMARRPDLKVVLMSATVDAQKFSQYLDGAPIINVPGRTFPVEAKFLEDAIELTGHTNEDAESGAVDEDSIEDDEQQKTLANEQLQGYSKKTVKTLENYDEYRIDYSLIVKLLEKVGYHAQYQPFSKAILVFLPGIAEIRQLNDMLLGHPRFAKGWRIHPLHSTFSSEDQQAAFVVPPQGIRKIVLATNIAETGITIPDVTCVIDTGKHKEMRFDERRQMSRLIQSFIARANAKQRRGRAGRVQEGLCFHLFTKHRHDQLMVEQQTPEMLRLSLQDLVMRVKICKLGDIETALSQALDPPSSRNIRRAIDALVEVGALTSQEELTSLGTQLAKLPLDAQLGKLILLGSNFGCLDFVLTAAAALSSKSPFLSPLHAKKQADSVRLGYKRGDSDLLTLYNAYSTWRKICTTPGMSEYQFCNKNFLSPQNLANIEELKGQLLSSLLDARFVALGPEERSALSKLRYHSRQRHFVALPAQYSYADGNDTVITSVIAWSFYPKVVKQDGKGWRNIANNQSLGLHPTSVNKGSLRAEVKFLSFYSIMQSSSRFTNAQETSAVSDFALVLMAGEAVFHMYAGVIIVDGNRLRFKVRDWRTMIVLKTLRAKLKEVMAKLFKNPGRDLGDRPRRWMDLVQRVFERQQKQLPPSGLVQQEITHRT